MSDDGLTTTIGGSSLNPNNYPLGKILNTVPIANKIIQIAYPVRTPLAAQYFSFSTPDMSHLPTPAFRTLLFMDRGGGGTKYIILMSR